MNIPIFS